MDKHMILLSDLINMKEGELLICCYENETICKYERVIGGFNNYKFGKITIKELLILLNTDDYLYHIVTLKDLMNNGRI